MNWSEFEKQVEEDFTIRKDHLNTKLLEIPKLHSKYLRFYFKEKNKLIKLESELKILYSKRWYYYKNDYDHTIEDKHIQWHIDGDEEYSKKLLAVNRQKHLVDYFNQLIKKSNTLSFDIKNIVDWERFVSGLN